MNDFILVINYFFDVLGNLFNLLVSNWFFGFILLTLVFTFIVELFVITRGK